MLPKLKFNEHDAKRAFDDWNCNCGPGALAAVMGLTLDDVKPVMMNHDFATKHYTNPTMMKACIEDLGGRIATGKIGRRVKVFPCYGLARIQFTGPWTAPGANPKWAYRQTHWIASCWTPSSLLIFDINAGVQQHSAWYRDTIPRLIELYPRADGDWFVTHCWEVSKIQIPTAKR